MKKSKIVFLLVVFVIFAVPFIAFASYTLNQYPNITPIEKMHPNGKYIVYVEKGDKWKGAGSISFDKYFREREIDLTDSISSDKTITIRLVQQGGGAAHIDSISLGGISPVEVKNIENGLHKLSKQDFDVIDAFNRNIEITFPVNSSNRILKLTARVENSTISKIPFQFPLKNLFNDMDKNAQFYPYQLNSHKGIIRIDGVLNELGSWKPLFKEYYPSGSGHPSGFTYGWVWNDDQNLYVAIDFTPDNTMDGDKDYAKIYVKTENGLKEFKVSVPDTKWGKAAFVYTNKVSYQHKVYEFKIPLKEIISESIKSEKELQLAFATYGTATPARPAIFCNDSGQVPTIDGAVTWIGEWQNPPQFTIDPETDPQKTSNELLAHFYCKNDLTYIYILLDAVGDESSVSECDECFFVFWVGDTKYETEIWTGFTNGTELPPGSEAAVGFSTTMNSGTNHRIYEFKIPFSSINASPGQALDFASPSIFIKTCGDGASMPYDSSTGRDNVWPRTLIFDNRDTWGILQTNGTVEVPTLTEWGIIIFIMFATVGSVYYLKRQKKTGR